MTAIELQAAKALSRCSFLPGSFDKQWVQQLDNWKDRDMTYKGQKMLVKLLEKYRRQIPNHERLINEVTNQLPL